MSLGLRVKLVKDDVFKITGDNSGVEIYVDKKKDDYTPLGPNPSEMFLASIGA